MQEAAEFKIRATILPKNEQGYDFVFRFLVVSFDLCLQDTLVFRIPPPSQRCSVYESAGKVGMLSFFAFLTPSSLVDP